MRNEAVSTQRHGDKRSALEDVSKQLSWKQREQGVTHWLSFVLCLKRWEGAWASCGSLSSKTCS